MIGTDNMQNEFSGKTAIVTGASKGIGFTLAKALVDRGANVTLVARNKDDVDAAARGLGERALAVALDLASPGAPAEIAARTVDKFGGIDHLINNAGLNTPGRVDEYTADDLMAMASLNLIGTSLMTQASIDRLAQSDSGSILNISTAGSLFPTPGISFYGATKAAINYLTGVWATELAPQGIRVNALCPGPTATPQFSKVENVVPNYRDQVISQVVLRRVSEPEELVPAAMLLLSPQAGGYITGAVLNVDGGFRPGND